MSRIDNGNIGDIVQNNLRETSDEERTARSIGNSLTSIEEKYMKALSNPNSKDGDVQALQIKYQRAMRAYEAFQQLMKNANELLLRGIQNLSIR